MPRRDLQTGVGRTRATEEDYLRCIRCGLCSYTCPTYRVLLTQAQSPRGRVALLRAASQDDAEISENLADKIYSCTLCGACAQVCPSGVAVDDLLVHAREELAERDLLPSGLARLSQSLKDAHNISGEDNASRLIWAQNLQSVPAGVRKEQADVVYFVGCVSSFFPRSYSIPQATVQILEAAQVDYALLGGGEWCCGFPLLVNGSWSDATETVLHNVRRVRAMGANQVVFTCPSCYHLWKTEYPAIAGAAMGGLAIRHISELLVDLIQDGSLPLQPVDEVVTYHDPCDLGRKSGVIEAPRRVLRAIPGLSLVEMSDTRENSLCCGGGGNLETYDPALLAAAARRRLAQAQRTRAHTVVSACQQCERTLANAARQQGVKLRVMDLTEIVWKSVAR
jgi:heterodisulfide reductase subunit D